MFIAVSFRRLCLLCSAEQEAGAAELTAEDKMLSISNRTWRLVLHIMPLRDIDAADRRILSELQSEAKLTNVELARRIGLSPSPCLTRVRALERDGIISSYVALVSPESLGLGISVFIQITLERQVEQALETFETRMQSYPEVMECYLMTGDSDYLLRVVVREMTELQRFIVQQLSKIPGVATIRSGFALKQVKYKTSLPMESDLPKGRKLVPFRCASI